MMEDFKARSKRLARMNVPRKRYTIELEVPLRAGVTETNLIAALPQALSGIPHQAQIVKTIVLNADGTERKSK